MTPHPFVIGFDGSSGTKRPGRADSTAVVVLAVGAPATPRIAGYWEDDGTPGWTPPRPTVVHTVEALLADPACVGMGADTAGWGEELATWQGTHGSRMRSRRFSLSATELRWAWQLLHENITHRVILFDEAAADYRLFEEHILAMRLDDAGRIDKANGGPSAGRIDIGAALSHACFARNKYLSLSPRSTEDEPTWPRRVQNIYARTPAVPANVPCALPGCDELTASAFHSEDCLALYRARWPDSKQLQRHAGTKLVAPRDDTATARADFARWWNAQR